MTTFQIFNIAIFWKFTKLKENVMGKKTMRKIAVHKLTLNFIGALNSDPQIEALFTYIECFIL